MTVLTATDAMITRRDLLGTEVLPDPEAERARRIVANATSRLQLLVEVAALGRTVDGWATADEVVWHVEGDDGVTRLAIVTPAAHVSATVARMVGLGPRPDAEGELRIRVADLRASLAGDQGSPPVARVWTFSRMGSGGSARGFTIVDHGDHCGLRAVAGSDDDVLTLVPVTPLDVWLRLAAL
jgi:hypothetical protein